MNQGYKSVQVTKMNQSLNMTASLQQSIKLLQFSTLELLEYINQQLEVNPLLFDEQLIDETQDEGKEQPQDDADDDIWTNNEKPIIVNKNLAQERSNDYNSIEQNALPLTLKRTCN